ncbi:biogenesis of lysosome-related organelles complex 1 subunit 4-like [Branchiostoma floridae]|uniref:Biogenesis of lysosome-related organelles complex 1 subunit 4-like n=1 Tax=Branchiostoma floridae TaxID=7739 RepID=A0A9J7LA52_BRAFL|nr:biogenesis of lysosome-related organelles complex 1 subunit 4-like [Branchiostoma floridae]
MAEESPQKQSPPEKSEEMLPVLEQTCADYSLYLDVDTDKERKMIEDSIEEMLTHLDEFCGVIDMVRSESNLALNKTLPELYERSLEIRKTYERIDQLEAFVNVVRRNVNMMEELVNQAERDYSSLNSIKSLFTNIKMPIFAPKKPVAPKPEQRKKFVPPEIFKTDDFFPPKEDSNPNTSTEER